MWTNELLKFYGYPVEVHKIHTDDGYINTFFRFQAKGTSIRSGLPVLYFQHGLLDSSDGIISNEPSKNPGFRFAEWGYDVWLGNNRGNKYSMEHEHLSTKDKAYWKFSFEEYAFHDLPSAFAYITKVTGQE